MTPDILTSQLALVRREGRMAGGLFAMHVETGAANLTLDQTILIPHSKRQYLHKQDPHA